MRAHTKQTLAMVGLALVVVLLIAGLFLGLRSIASWNLSGHALGNVYTLTDRIGDAVSGAVAGFRGADEHSHLEVEIMRLRSQVASLQDVQEENVFLRQIADLEARQSYQVVVSGIFSYALVGQEVQVRINAGERDGVVPGAAVVTGSGALLGFVHDVSARSATVRVLGDPALQVTGRIAGVETGGLVHVDGTGRLMLDLIGKDEVVSEGDLVVTSGLDHAPPGLIIGRVRSVDPESTTLFQQIRLDVAHETGSTWRVIILIP